MGIMMIAGTEHRRQGCSLQDGKQWGYYVESQNPTDYRYWSIPFTSHYITMATKTYYEPKEEAVPWLVGTDMQKFICGYGANFIGSSYVSCVGIGCQPQWGYQKQLTVEPVVYPLPVNTVCCVWAHSIHDRQDPGTYHSILSKITPVGVQILAGQYNAPATAYSGISAYWGMIGW